MSDAPFANKNVLELDCGEELEGDEWKSEKSSSSKAPRFVIVAPGALLEDAGGGMAKGVDVGRACNLDDVLCSAMFATLAADNVRGDFDIGGGTGGDACNGRSTGDWKSEKSSSSNRFEVKGIAVGDFALCACDGGRSSGIGLAVFENVLTSGVSVARGLDGKLDCLLSRNGCAER